MEKIYTKVFRLIDVKREGDILTLLIDIESEVNNCFQNTFLEDFKKGYNEDLIDIFKFHNKNKCQIIIHCLELNYLDEALMKYINKRDYIFLEIHKSTIEIWEFKPLTPYDIFGDFCLSNYHKIEFKFFD